MRCFRSTFRANLALICSLVLTTFLTVAPAQAQDADGASDPSANPGSSIFLPVITAQGNPATARAAQANPAAIKLKAATFIPGQGGSLPPGLTIAGYAQGQRGYYIVQLAGPVQQAWKDHLISEGADLLGYIPDFAFKVRMNPAQAARVAQLAEVAWVDIYQPAYKLAPELDRDGIHLYQVEIERGANAGLTTAAIARTGAQVIKQAGNIVFIGADSNQLEAIAHVLDVAWIDNYVLPQKHNDAGAGVIVGANMANSRGYDGSTQIAAVADTGLGNGTAAGAHPDIPAGRIVNIHNWPGVTDICFQSISDDGAIDVDSGHGTHVSASVLSDGGAGGVGKGGAPAASLVFQATENWAVISNYCQLFGGYPPSGYFLTGLPANLNNLYQQAYSDGARIHANSWGSAQAGVYTASSAQTDEFVWNNPDMAITFSAGNEGEDANNNGVVDSDSIGSPATAKNVITVGASENVRSDNWPCDSGLGYTSQDSYQAGQTCSSMGGQNYLGTWGERYGFSTNPLKDDVTAGNQEQMASWSSRGPVDDGRIKPDIVAPGTWILSGYSSLHQEGYGDPTNPQTGGFQWDGWGMPANNAYKYMGGTSMSNPIAAGAATVVRDFYQKEYGFGASAALVKATLINSAIDMADENNDGSNDNDFPIPNIHEGWGRINLDNATDGIHQYVDDGSGLSTGGSDTRQFNVVAGSSFKVTLVWSDYPSTEAAAQNLVNDLDLLVTAPGGAQYQGNVFSGGWSSPNAGAADRINNVENVYVQSADAGPWTVEVIGFNTPQGPQPYALVIDGAFGAVNNPPVVTISAPVTGATFGSGASISFAGAANDVEEGDLTSSLEWTSDINGLIGTGGAFSAVLSDGAHTITASVTDGNGASGSDSINITVGSPPTVHVADLDGSSTTAPRGRWTATVTIAVHNKSEAAISGATVDGAWSNGASGGASCVTDGSGQCSVTKNNVKGNVANVTFSVTNIASAAGAYAAADNHDPDSDSFGTTITVNKPGSNTAPTATISAPANGATFASGASVGFAGSANDAEDGDVTASLAWSSNIDGAIGSGASFTASLSDGYHTVTATATDSAGATGSTSINITVGDPGNQPVLHVGSITAGTSSGRGGKWNATVTITVHDENEATVGGATVNGSWSDGANGSGSCVTSGAGTCTITKNNINKNSSSVRFTVNSVSAAGSTYDAGVNHDPIGATLVISKP